MKIPHLRWWIISLITLGTIVNYLARNTLSVLAPQLQTQMHITTAQYSYVVGAFQLAYTVMQPVCGFVVDRLGLRLGFTLFAVAWSLANMAHALATGWMGLAVFRGLLGASEAAAIPSGVKASSVWFPAKERSMAVGWFNLGTSLGAMIAPPLVVAVTLLYSWQMAFIVTGAMGLIWAVIWYACYRDPSEHPALGDDERTLIMTDRPPVRQSTLTPLQLLRTPKFWTIAIPRFLSEPAWQVFSFWIPLYLAHERGMDLKHIAAFAWLPFLAADAGALSGGYIAPLLIKNFGVKLIPSRIYGIVGAALLMIGPGCIGLVASPYMAIALFCVGGFAHQTLSILINTLTADVYPPEDVGMANGFVGQMGWIGGLLFSLLIGQMADRVGFGPLFGALGVFDLIGAAVLILAMKQLVPFGGEAKA
jgi:ACS family hexuronate transporter-like MFS transporter